VRIVYHDRNAIIDLVSKAFADESVRGFRRSGGKVRQVFAVIAEIYIEVVCLNVPPLELLVFHFVLAENSLLGH
jgi:hypothetical protein